MKIDLSKWGLNNQRLVFLLTAILTVGGFVAYYNMPKLEDPEIVVRQALVVGVYPGASAHQVELELTDPLEKGIKQIGDIETVQSYSYADMCYLLVSQDSKVPEDKLSENWNIMRNKISDIKLPSESQIIVKDDFGDVYGLFYAMKGDGIAPQRMEAYAEMVRRELQRIDGVAHVDIYGAQKQCVNIMLRQDKLSNLNIMPAEILTTLNNQNANVYSGYYQNGDHRIRVSINDRYKTVDDISNLILQGHENDQIKLKDIAEVRMEPEKVNRAEFLRDGQSALGISVAACSGTDIVKIGKAVEEKMEELKANRLPASISCEKVFFQSDRVQDAMLTFIINLVESVLLVIVLLIFCMNFRSGVILGATLVITVLGTIFILYYFDGTLQRVSLGSFILAMGMLVDNAIVIVDGILVDKKAGKPRSEALTAIGRKTAMPLLGATLIAILAFMPIFMSPDVTGLYVRDMFIVLAVSLLLSWVLALVLVPIIASYWIYAKDEEQSVTTAKAEDPFTNRWYQGLTNILQNTLAHPWATVAVMVILLVITGFCYTLMPRTLFPDMEYDQLYMEYKLPEGNNTTKVRADLEEIRKKLEKMDDVTHVTTSVGATPCRYNLVRPVNLPSLSYGELIVDFKSPRALEKNYEALQKQMAAEYPDAYLLFKRYNLMFMRYPIELRFVGPDPAVLHQLADTAMTIAKRLKVIEPVKFDWDPKVPTMVVNYDQTHARNKAISRSEVGMSLMSATDGIPVGNMYDGITPHNIYLNVTDNNNQPTADLNNATVFGMLPNINSLLNKDNIANQLMNVLKGSGITGLGLTTAAQLKEVSDGINVEWEDPIIPRYNNERIQSIVGTPANGYLTEEARAILAKEVEKIQLPEGYSIDWGGEKHASDLSLRYLFAPYPVVILLMIAILVWLFKRFRTALLLFCCIPFVFVGIIPAILASGNAFNFVAIVGALGLVGMMLKNGIVLVDEIRLQLASGKEQHKALIDASKTRLRPVTMASLTTILGMVPLLFDDMFSAMAATIMGGLLAGTIIVLVIIPVLYSLFYKPQPQTEA
jgi:multidrug efflux pump subunit AcrB